ncbi:MAG: DUF4870 domain-containing protein [Phycisphaerales bacterium]|nr:DUF4870 domain-containing protein [Phycisphaerales bacterium]
MVEQQPIPEDSNEQSVEKMPPRRVIHSEEPETNSDQRMIAMLAHLLGIVSGPIAALVIMLVKKGDDWVEGEAREALNFQITILLIQICGVILTIVLVGILVLVAAAVLNVIFCVIAAATVHSGKSYRYPLAIRLIQHSV